MSEMQKFADHLDWHPLQAVLFLLISGGKVLMERCPRKAERHGGEWFIPGGRIEPTDPTVDGALLREMAEELDCLPVEYEAMPLADMTGGSNYGSFLVRPYLVSKWYGTVPEVSQDRQDTPLAWIDIEEAKRSPIAGVRAILARLSPSAG